MPNCKIASKIQANASAIQNTQKWFLKYHSAEKPDVLTSIDRYVRSEHKHETDSCIPSMQIRD